MKEIVVISGKGGTGKTCITAAIAYEMGSNCILADCDVDAADMHLIFKPQNREDEDFFSGVEPEIELANCKQCLKCMDVCRFDAISALNGKPAVDVFLCEGCGYCARVCPSDAIVMKDRYAGQLFCSAIRTGTQMVHAELIPGGENSGKLVAKVKKRAREIAESKKTDYILVDGSPGIGCPVISSLSGADYVILVTEPSKSALCDLKRVYELLKKFKIPAGCIVNKADLNNEVLQDINEFLKTENIPLLGSINYDTRVFQAVKNGKTINEYLQSDYKDFFKTVTKNIIREIK